MSTSWSGVEKEPVPVQWLVSAGIVMDEHGTVRLEDEQTSALD
jgi:hypothetical protein